MTDSTKLNRYWKFGTGSKETLGVPDIRARLIEWNTSHYSANLMKLAVLSSRGSLTALTGLHVGRTEGADPVDPGLDSLDEMEDWVLREYSPIPNRDMAAPVFSTPPFLLQQMNVSLKSFLEPDHRLLKTLQILARDFLSHNQEYSNPSARVSLSRPA